MFHAPPTLLELTLSKLTDALPTYSYLKLKYLPKDLKEKLFALAKRRGMLLLIFWKLCLNLSSFFYAHIHPFLGLINDDTLDGLLTPNADTLDLGECIEITDTSIASATYVLLLFLV